MPVPPCSRTPGDIVDDLHNPPTPYWNGGQWCGGFPADLLHRRAREEIISLRLHLKTWQAECEAWRTMRDTASAVINDNSPRERLDIAAITLRKARAATDALPTRK